MIASNDGVVQFDGIQDVAAGTYPVLFVFVDEAGTTYTRVWDVTLVGDEPEEPEVPAEPETPEEPETPAEPGVPSEPEEPVEDEPETPAEPEVPGDDDPASPEDTVVPEEPENTGDEEAVAPREDGSQVRDENRAGTDRQARAFNEPFRPETGVESAGVTKHVDLAGLAALAALLSVSGAGLLIRARGQH